ncbi:MAG: PfkB family carbohydrate kinase [Victivallaceae bacterium]|nr:PfkB family carbohydrate kinase [Victivallaceae bacterium]
MNDLESVLKRFERGRVAVVGDLMLDVYLWGRVSRISPEAPVPVVNISRRTSCLGGAANVVRNVATLGAKAHAFGVVGVDQCADELICLLHEHGVDSEAVVRDGSRPTTEKKRVIAGGQQLLREDMEAVTPVDEKIRRDMVSKVIGKIRSGELDAVIFEDYCKGVLAEWMLEEIVSEAAKRGVITALDPKPGSMKPVKGLTFMKPNRGEAFALVGVVDRSSPDLPVKDDAGLAAVADKLLDMWSPEYLLLSLAAQGMALVERDRPMRVIPTRAREVFDVSGAGDTVTAAFTLAMVSGATQVQAAELANLAAGVVVGKVGTVPIQYDELAGVLAADSKK